jgi:hypothetical protein
LAAEWTVSDLCLLYTAGEGLGLEQYEPAMAAYVSGYIDMVRTRRVLIVSPQVTITAVTLTPGVFEWPALSGDNYVGVEAVLTVKELT